LRVTAAQAGQKMSDVFHGSVLLVGLGAVSMSAKCPHVNHGDDFNASRFPWRSLRVSRHVSRPVVRAVTNIGSNLSQRTRRQRTWEEQMRGNATIHILP